MAPYILFSIFFFFYDQFLPTFTTFLTLTALYKSIGKIFKTQIFAFLTSELKSTLNFSLENILYLNYILANLFFPHQMSAKPWSDFEPCHMVTMMILKNHIISFLLTLRDNLFTLNQSDKLDNSMSI